MKRAVEPEALELPKKNGQEDDEEKHKIDLNEKQKEKIIEKCE